MIAFWISLANPSCPSAPNLAPIREKYGVVENIIPGEVRQAKMHKVSDIRLRPASARFGMTIAMAGMKDRMEVHDRCILRYVHHSERSSGKLSMRKAVLI